MADTNGRSSRPRSRRAAPRSTRSTGRAGSPTTGTGKSSRAGRKRRFFDYPRTGYSGLHRWLPSWRFVLGTFLAFCFLVAGAVVAAYATVQIPKVGEDISAQTTSVYYAGSQPGQKGELMGTLPGVNRTIVEYSTLPDYVGKAAAAGEDKTFFTNRGVDVKGMARAMVNNLRGGRTQGGSTLTQEYVERYYVGKTTTSYTGKAKEALLAIKLSKTQSKDEILGRWLNTVYFGRGAYGIQAASQVYFGVDAKDLTVSQAAMLMGIVPSPSYWDPAVSPDKAKARWNVILDSMESMGWLSAKDRATQEFPATLDVKNDNRYKGPNGYLLKQVIEELRADPYKMSDQEIETGGYSIITTIQKPAQDAAVATAGHMWDGTIGGNNKPNVPDPNAKLAIVSIDPTDGAIIAEYGGKDFLTDQKNAATFDPGQAGSTYKPYALVAALEQGIGLDTRFNGASPQTIPGWDPQNGNKVKNDGDAKGEQFGNIDLVQATAQSVNTVYAQLNMKVGADKTAEAAIKAGLPAAAVHKNNANVLGTDNVAPLDIADAYATFAAGGKHSTAFIVRTVLHGDGGVRAQHKADTTQVFSPDVIADATYAMSKVVDDPKGTAHKWISPLGRPIAGKTGTTSDNVSALFAGFTPHISTTVVLRQYGADNKSRVTITPFQSDAMKSGVLGGTIPAHIWADYMAQVFQIPQFAEKTPFPPRANVGGKPTATAVPTPTDTATAAPQQTQPATVTVPGNLVGRLQADATATLFNAGLQPQITSAPSDTVPAGRVISVSPGEGATVSAGDAVTVVVSTGPASKPTQTPPPPTPTPSAPPPGNGNAAGGGSGGTKP